MIIKTKQEGHDGPGLLTWVSCEPRIFKLTDFGIKQAKVTIYQRTPDIAISEVKECLQ